MFVGLEETWNSADARRCFENLYPMYLHELAAFGADLYALDAAGRWQPDLARSWTEPVTGHGNLLEPRPAADRSQPFQRGYTICVDRRRVGFVCVALPPFRYMDGRSDFQLSELFVVHRYRGCGVAVVAVRELFSRYKGRWELGALRDNTRAVSFWRRSLSRLGARDLVATESGADIDWRFTIV
jgi:predicted acetyltransferase